jgi:hypothetical protein
MSSSSLPDPKPRTFEELKQLSMADTSCRRCNTRKATHAISMTATEKQAQKGVVVMTMKKVPVCEQCGVELFAVVKKALRL